MGVLGNHLLNCAGFHASDRGFGIATLNEDNYTWVLSRLAVDVYKRQEETSPELNLYKVYDFALTAPLDEIRFILDTARLNKAEMCIRDSLYPLSKRGVRLNAGIENSANKAEEELIKIGRAHV